MSGTEELSEQSSNVTYQKEKILNEIHSSVSSEVWGEKEAKSHQRAEKVFIIISNAIFVIVHCEVHCH